jgi:hypothetical protein
MNPVAKATWFTKPVSGGGLLLLRRKAPLKRRSVAYFCSGAHNKINNFKAWSFAITYQSVKTTN